MKLEIEIPDGDFEEGFKFNWTDGFEIETSLENNTFLLWANKEGLISLANHLLNLAQDKFPKGQHFHLEDYNGLEEGSVEMIIGKK